MIINQIEDYRIGGNFMVSKKRIIEWRANWIWKKDGKSPRNYYLYVRRSFYLDKIPTGKTLMKCTADSKYKLFVNGAYIGRGPVRSDPRWQYYDVHDLGRHLRRGKNVLAFLVHHYGEGTFSYVTGRGALLFQVDFIGQPQMQEPVISDNTCKVARAEAWDERSLRMNIQQAFSEIYDARKEITNWNQLEFDDSGWENAEVIGNPPMEPWVNLVERDIPFLTESEVFPVEVVEVGECRTGPGTRGDTENIAFVMARKDRFPLKSARVEQISSIICQGPSYATIQLPANREVGVFIIIDFGKEVSGYPRLKIRSSEGGIISLGYAEHLDDGRVNPFINRTKYADRYIMRRGGQFFEMFNPRGFRYILLDFEDCPGPVEIESISLDFCTYPVEYKGCFECSDSLLNRIWEVGRYTVQLCMEDAYIDCPQRERVQWQGDVRLDALVNYYTFGDTLLMAKGLRQITQSQRSDGIMWGFYPASLPPVGDHIVPVWTMFWIISLWEYYLFTNDKQLLQELYPNLLKVLSWFEECLDEHRLLTDVPYWLFYDWGTTIYDKGTITAVNCFYYAMLVDAARICEALGDSNRQELLQRQIIKVKQSINERLWSEKRGLYVDYRIGDTMSEEAGEHPNILVVLYDIAEPPRLYSLIKRIFDEGRDIKYGGTPWSASFVLGVMCRTGRYHEALSFIRKRWGKMLECGATTWWEEWHGRSSWCHGWSSAPTWYLSAEVLGVKPILPGFEKFAVRPVITDLQWAKGIVPSVRGEISVSWRKGDQAERPALVHRETLFSLEMSHPPDTQAEVSIPKFAQEGKKIVLDGNLVWLDGQFLGNPAVESCSEDMDYVNFVLVPARGVQKHVFCVQKQELI